MANPLLLDIPEQHQEKAEEIRAYLVLVRGGAPFLSGADCTLLVKWLDEKVSIAAITTAIDRVAARRRAKRVRSRMSLNVCKGELRKILGHKTKTPKELKPIKNVGLKGLVQNLRRLDVPTSLSTAKQVLVQTLTNLSQNDGDLETLAKKAIKGCRDFHETVWRICEDQHEQLQLQSEQELASLRNLLGEQHWREMVEEVMRDKLRSRFPLISAQSIWNAINLSENGA
ncbi:MAG: hypothetical protein VX278_06230 [Myxococcota bacterium]|nr:hypothetical protein [Myxococcota bacterium]